MNEETNFTGRKSVLQSWVQNLSLMQQSVLLAAVRGPDGLHKEHIVKSIVRWYRRCFLMSAFDRVALTDPEDPRGGSFTGSSPNLYNSVNEYLKAIDQVPLHFHLHLMHASEILGYKHPIPWIRKFWNEFYLKMANDFHLNPETEEQMDKRLGDNEEDWKAAEKLKEENEEWPYRIRPTSGRRDLCLGNKSSDWYQEWVPEDDKTVLKFKTFAEAEKFRVTKIKTRYWLDRSMVTNG